MGAHTLLSRNLGILLKLNDGSANIEELAKSEACPQGLLRTPLKVLLENNLIIDNNGTYSLNLKSESYQILNLIKPWLSYKDDSNYSLAKDIAKIIHDYSYSDVGVESVLLFGSTLKQDKVSGDIDMLILHHGTRLREFYKDPYGEHKNDPHESDRPAIENNRRQTSARLIGLLGYQDDNNTDWRINEESREKNSVYSNIIRRLKDTLELKEEEFIDSQKFFSNNREAADKGINEILDIHVMSTNLLLEPFGRTGRNNAILSCRDPTFWYTVFNEGMIYDTKKQDFTIKPSEKYDIELFNTK
ncbi:MAG: hypothetical protein ACP5N1_05055 [Candidatus Woesearchaeota archaeon]